MVVTSNSGGRGRSALGLQWAQEAHINWELNERISLSSAASSVRSTNSKRSQSPGHRVASVGCTPVRRRWNASSNRLERTNDSLAKRVSVIEELNRKILANYDRMRGERGKVGWKPPEPEIGKQSGFGSSIAERKRALGEKVHFQRRAGGEWGLEWAEGKTQGQRVERFFGRERDEEVQGDEIGPSLLQCTLSRANGRWSSRMPEGSSSVVRTVAVIEKPPAWTQKEEEVVEEQQQEKSVLRELNEAIDRFEEEEEDRWCNDKEEEEEDSKSASWCHDCSWDSGVGVDLSSSGLQSSAASPPARGTGWLRVHTGIEASLIYLTHETSAADVCRDMLLSENLALFVQYHGESGRRLSPRERPLELQEELLETLGYREPTKRARLGLDAELRHLIAFHVGPAAPLDELRGYSRCGYALVLKGLVFPQWKRRALAVLGSRLFLYPACSESRPEWMELAGGGSVCCAPSRLGKLVLRVTGYPARIASNNNNSGAQQRRRIAAGRETRHLYIGFHHPWDRDLWRSWLKQACRASLATSEEEEEEEDDGQQQKEGAVAAGRVNKLDMSGSGVARLPEAARAFHGVREFFLGHNQLAQLDGNLKLLHSFPELRELHLENNRLTEIPRELLSLGRLTFLDLSDNGIHRIPAGIASLTSLRELILDRNDVKELPDEIVELRRLEHLSLVGNLIELLPGFLLEMRALALADVLGGGGSSRPDNVSSPGTSKLATSSSSSFSSTSSSSFSAAASTPEEKSSVHNNVLSKVNLRNNQLKGNIILGNYGNVTHLDLSENNIETLDLSALQELRSVRCARNQLTELTLCGRSLVSLIAGNNKLKVLSISPVPVNLEHLDVSYNELDSLPEWTPELPVLRALFASHNKLTALPDRLLSQPTASRLEVLHLPHNRLQALPPPRRQLSLVHLTLQDNDLTALPANFFANTLKMKVLNLSNNRLSELPGVTVDGNNVNGGQKARNEAASSLEKIYLTSNSLTNTALDVLAKFSALRVLHLAYNALDTLPEICVASWKELEELVLSGNKLQYLPDNVASLAHLRVLRVHSNRLLRCPAFNRTPSLKVLDLAHNHLEHLNLDSLLSSQLQFLDISCNSRLHVDPRQFQSYHSTRRPVSLVDVSGQSKSTVCTPETSATSSNNSSPSTGASARNDSVELNHHLPWRLGFSETTGARERLLISQLRMPAFCGTECLFGLFDGCSSQEAPSSLQEMIPRLLLDESAVKETRSEYLRYTLLSAQRELREKGQKYGIDAALVHVTRLEPEQLLDDDDGGDRGRPRYLLTAATCGEARAVLCRASGPLQLAKSTRLVGLPRLQAALGQGRKVHSAAHDLLPIALPEPTSEKVVLEEDDEFVIIGNRRLWEVLSIQEAVRQARAEANPVLAAKRLQDLGQAYGAEDNLSVIVLRLSMANASNNNNNSPSSSSLAPEPLNRLLMRELRQAVHSKSTKEHLKQQALVSVEVEHHQQPQPTQQLGCTCPCCTPRLSANHEAPVPCCCHAAAAMQAEAGLAACANNGFYLNGVLRNVVSARSSAKSSKSSQGLSKDASSVGSNPHQREDRSSPSGQSDQTTSDVGLFEPRSRRRTSGRTGGRFCSGSASAGKIRQLQGSAGAGSVAGSERSPPPSDEQLRCWEYMLEQNTQLLFDKELDTLTSAPSSTSRSTALRRGQSRSTPQLGSSTGVPFLSRRFGSARSFETTSGAGYQQPLVQPVPVIRSAFGGSARRLLNGGPNAAYFGSLQRLMPYNLEYDFAVIQERGALDSLEQDASRMQQYWGVATTEL